MHILFPSMLLLFDYMLVYLFVRDLHFLMLNTSVFAFMLSSIENILVFAYHGVIIKVKY